MKLKEKSGRAITKTEILKLISVLLCLAMIVFSCVFLIKAPKIVLMLVFLTFASFGIVIPGIDGKTHEALLKSLFVALMSIAAVLAIYIVLDATGVLSHFTNVEQMIELIRKTGAAGSLVFVLLVVLNTVFLPIPAAVPAVIGTVLYGPLWSFIFMAAGTVTGSVIIFSLGRIFGKTVAVWMVGKEKTEKYSRFLNKKGRPAFVFMIIFPFFPDDILCLIAGLSRMSWKYFLGVICTVRTAVLAFMCFFSDGKIIPFTGWGIWIWIAIGVLMIGAFAAVTVMKNKILKKKPLRKKSSKKESVTDKSTVNAESLKKTAIKKKEKAKEASVKETIKENPSP